MVKIKSFRFFFVKNLLFRIFLIFFFTHPLYSQNNSGNEFWIAFTKIPWDKENHIYLYITSSGAAKGKVTCSSQNFEKRFALRPNELAKIEIPRKVLIDSTEIISNKAVLVESDKPVIVTGLNYQQYGSEAFLALPKESIGKEYFAMCYPGTFPSHILCVANEDNTSILVNPSTELENQTELPIKVKLNRGQTYLLRSVPQRDLTGSLIKSNKPISVFTGNFGSFIPNIDYCCANHLVEQLPPLGSWGKVYYSSPLSQKYKGDVYKIVASDENSIVYIDGDSVTNLHRGGFFETVLSSNKVSRIESNKPILVAQFSTSNQYDSIPRSDPFMTLLPPTEQYSDEYNFIVPDEGFEENYFNIITSSPIVNNYLLDNKVFFPPLYDTTGTLKPFSSAIMPGSHTIKSSDYSKFGLNVYGYSRFDAYGYSGGLGLEEINCGLLSDENFSMGLSVSIPFAFGVQFEYNYKNYNLVLGYLFAPSPAWGTVIEPPDSIKKDNFQHNIYLSPGYIFPINCKIMFFGGPYIAFGIRYWKNFADNIPYSPPYYTGLLSGKFIEYYFGLYFGLKYFFKDPFYAQLAASINMQTTHRFYDEKIISTKLGGALFFSLNYKF